MPRPATGQTFIARQRVPKPRWDRLDRAAKSDSTDRSKVVNDLIAWYLREPGAKLPARPPRSAGDEPADS